MNFDDRRQFPRRACRYPASVEGPRGPVRGTCTDLSLGGLFIEGVSITSTSAAVTVEFPIGKFTFQAQVRRVSTAPVGTGFQFMRLEPHHIAVLQQYAQR